MRQLKINKQITVRNNTLDKYLTEIAKYDLLTQEEEVELAQRIKEGDIEAEKEFINANLRFVISVAKQYSHANPLLLSDLINEGNIGLIIAARRFDHTRGFKFISYAVWWIRQTIQAYLDINSTILKTATNTSNRRKKIKDYINYFFTQEGRNPEIIEISEGLNMSEIKINDALNSSLTISGDTHLNPEDPNNTIFDNLSFDDDSFKTFINSTHLQKQLSDAMEVCMNDKEQEILIKTFGINCEQQNLQKIGKDFNVSHERIRQLKEKAIRKLRKYLINHKIEL